MLNRHTLGQNDDTGTTDEIITKISYSVANISNKVDHIKCELKMNSFGMYFSQMIDSHSDILFLFQKSINILKNVDAPKDDFIESLNIINTAFISYHKFLNSISNPQKSKSLITQLQIEINTFSQYFLIFSSIIKEIMNNITYSNISKNLILQLGIESALFNYAVNVKFNESFPFYRSKYAEVYKFHNTINKINHELHVIKSFYGTGKTFCIPLILMSRELKEEKNSPYFIMIQPSSEKVEIIKKLFEKNISQYVTIVTEIDTLIELSKSNEQEKLVLALFTPESLLKLIFNFKDDTSFYSKSRFIIDDLNQRSFMLDVLITKIAYLNHVKKCFSLSLNVSFLTSSIENSILSPFRGSVDVTTLMGHSSFEITENVKIVDKNISKTRNEMMIYETLKVFEEMSKINSEIEDGSILCFLSDFNNCNRVKNIVILTLKNKNQSEDKRGIVIMKTSLESSESIETFFDLLRNEYQSYSFQNSHDFLFIIPLVLTDLSLYEELQNEFPDDLNNIHKLIFTTQISESFNFDDISVVIDCGLEFEDRFDCFTCLTKKVEKQASKFSMNKRKGRLGKCKKGLYVPIMLNENVPDFPTPEIERMDLTEDVLALKGMDIEIEKMKNLPNKPNCQNLHFALNNLKYIGAVDKKTSKITNFGYEILKCPFVNLYYKAAILYFRESFPKEDQNMAYFIAFYIAILISMEDNLIQEEMSEKMLNFFCADSDIVTLISALNVLLKEETDDKGKVESYGFSYSSFLVLKSHLQKFIDKALPGKTVHDIISNEIDAFITKYEGMAKIIDQFIYEIEYVYPKWSENHYINFKYVSSNENQLALVFECSSHLNNKSEIRISSRPGWKGIMTPTECYYFNISQSESSGRLIHRITSYLQSGITSIKIDKFSLNSWLKVLVEIYFESDNFDDSSYLPIFNCRGSKLERKLFHFSNTGDNFFVSFFSNKESVREKIINGISHCSQLMPFTPRSILIFHCKTKALIEITSIGTEQFISNYSNLYPGGRLDKKKIDFCVKNIDELKKINSHIRICALFVNDNCKVSDYDQNNLYFINTRNRNMPQLNETVMKYIKQKNDESEMNKRSQNYVLKQQSNEFSYFQFPTNIVHPALIYNQESLSIIMKWFAEKCQYARIEKVVGHRFLMKKSEIRELRNHLENEKQQIMHEMNLNYVAIPIPEEIYSKSFLTIREHSKWSYDSKFKMIITTKDEEKEVRNFIQKVKFDLEGEDTYLNSNDYISTNALCCCYICNDPENPTLTKLPITIYNEDGTTYTNKMCRDCILDSLQNSIEPFFSNGKIDSDAFNNVHPKPFGIPSVPSKENKDRKECWPQIPLGQMISALINNDDEMSSCVSSWLQLVCEYTIRTQMKQIFTFCPNHPDRFYNIFNIKGRGFECGINGCKNTYCVLCQSWHPKGFECKNFKNQSMCPKCRVITYKDGGCNHVSCPCGCHWCFLCGAWFLTSSDCYSHLSRKHGGYWS